MAKIFTKNYEINYYDVDYKLKCKLSSIINFICDVGTRQSESIGGGLEYCTKNNCAWVFYKYDIKMFRYPVFGEKISITTEPIGFKKFYGLRKYYIKDEKGNLVGEALALFFLINIEKRRPMRIQPEQYDFYGVDGDMDYDISMEKIEKMENEQYSRTFDIRYSDIDSNKHVNNVKYIEWALEVVPIDIITNYELKRIKVNFEKEISYGNKIQSVCETRIIDKEKLNSYHVIKSSEGKELTMLELQWEKAE